MGDLREFGRRSSDRKAPKDKAPELSKAVCECDGINFRLVVEETEAGTTIRAVECSHCGIVAPYPFPVQT